MKVVILAGGQPSSLTDDKIPKPMLKVGERPLLWHIMKHFSMYGYDDFIICTGYRSELIKDYFMNYYIYCSDITVDLRTNDVQIHRMVTDQWKVSIVNTGIESSTANRIKIIENYIEDDNFIITYGDCVSDINIKELQNMHLAEENIMTVAVSRPSGRSAILPINQQGLVDNIYHTSYVENEAWASTGTVIAQKNIFSYIEQYTSDRFEVETLFKIATNESVGTYQHTGFWIPVETNRDRYELESKWNRNEIAWRD